MLQSDICVKSIRNAPCTLTFVRTSRCAKSLVCQVPRKTVTLTRVRPERRGRDQREGPGSREMMPCTGDTRPVAPRLPPPHNGERDGSRVVA
eukprot:4175510-Prymnesium_polylepis.3